MQTEPFSQWLSPATRELRETAEFTQAMAAAAAASYFETYTTSWSQEGVKQAMAELPQVRLDEVAYEVANAGT